jgi:hypothetical protein
VVYFLIKKFTSKNYLVYCFFYKENLCQNEEIAQISTSEIINLEDPKQINQTFTDKEILNPDALSKSRRKKSKNSKEVKSSSNEHENSLNNNNIKQNAVPTSMKHPDLYSAVSPSVQAYPEKKQLFQSLFLIKLSKQKINLKNNKS